ncbi:cysteine-rich CWC family protein [uncultured Amphritea sp.]|uniref:cysteine-rich CWC family protein n=1 Tax=uncultured Amphritea sp. TaxID=981605 RepID=UPI003432A0EA
MNTTTDTIDPGLCPLCRQSNECGNIASCGSDASCWCSSPGITFPDSLLDKVPAAAKGKACICRSCAANRVN